MNLLLLTIAVALSAARGAWRGATRAPPAHRRRAAAPRLGWMEDAAALQAAKGRASKELTLVAWLEENGVHMNELAGWGRAAHPMRVEAETVDDFEPSGRGLLARKQISQGEAVLQINTRLCLTKERAQEVLGRSVVPDALGEYLAIALLLIHERAKGASSFWASYVDILPTTEEVGQSFTWADDELALLQGSAVVDSTESMQRKLRSEYAALQATTLAQHPALSAEVYSWEAFEWAMSMLFSRAINLREIDALALVPYADLLNHSPYSQSYFLVNSVPLSNQKEVALYADRAYARNDQIFISYGQKSNAELLLLYGFVVDRNLYDEVELTVALGDDDALYAEKRAFLERQGLKTKMAFPLLIDRYSSELVQFLRLCCAQPSDLPLEGLKYNERISPQNERAALGALIAGCEQALAEYPESEAEDAAMMDNARLFAALTRNQRMAVKLRRNEKRILERTIRVCETTLQDIERELSRPASVGGAGPPGLPRIVAR